MKLSRLTLRALSYISMFEPTRTHTRALTYIHARTSMHKSYARLLKVLSRERPQYLDIHSDI